MSFYEQALEILKQHRSRITEPRRLVLSAFDQAKKPLSPYQLKDICDRSSHKIDVVTIYRIIEHLEKLGLIHKIHSQGGHIKCSLDDAEAIHSFFTCQRCGTVEEFSGGDFTSFKETIEDGHGFKVGDCVLELRGYCNSCR